MIYWFTGQPGAGKTTLAKLLVNYLGENTFHVDGDDLREIIDNKDYSKEGRIKNITLAQNISKFLDNKGCNVVVSLVSPYRDVREQFKSNVIVREIYVYTTEDRGRTQYHVDDYEAPLYNVINIDTTHDNIETSFNKLIYAINS